MDRAEVVTRIADRVQYVTGIDLADLAHDKPLMGQGYCDSLDLAELAFRLEEDFAILEIPMPADSTIEKIADAVMAAMESART
jgi:acyl carrier protein